MRRPKTLRRQNSQRVTMPAACPAETVGNRIRGSAACVCLLLAMSAHQSAHAQNLLSPDATFEKIPSAPEPRLHSEEGRANSNAAAEKPSDTDRLKSLFGQRYDKQKLSYVLEKARSGYATIWRNPNSGREFSVVPTRAFRVLNAPCRDFALEIYGTPDRIALGGRACRQPSGEWELTESTDTTTTSADF